MTARDWPVELFVVFSAGKRARLERAWGGCEVPDAPPAPRPGCDDPTVGSLESRGASRGENMGTEKGRSRENKRRSQGKGELTLAKGIDFKPGHFLGQDGFWQVEEGRVVDREIVVIVLQDPHSCSLDAAGRGSRAGGAQRTVSTTPRRGAHTDGQDREGQTGSMWQCEDGDVLSHRKKEAVPAIGAHMQLLQPAGAGCHGGEQCGCTHS